MNIKLVQTGGPYGDATSSYDVIFPEGITVREFIRYIVDDYSINSPNKWGFFQLGDREREDFLEYNRGEAFYQEPRTTKERGEQVLSEIGDKPIKKIKANGGWSRMDYILYV